MLQDSWKLSKCAPFIAQRIAAQRVFIKALWRYATLEAKAIAVGYSEANALGIVTFFLLYLNFLHLHLIAWHMAHDISIKQMKEYLNDRWFIMYEAVKQHKYKRVISVN